MTSQALATIPAQSAVQARGVGMTDEQIQTTYRKAAALAQSGLFKDVTSAERAFAKLLIGHTLGLSEAQSLSLYAMDGKIEVPYQLLANFIRSREGFDYAVWWIKSKSGKAYGPDEQPPDGDREAVLATDDSPTDLRSIVGASIAFTGPEGPRGVSTWTIEDTLRAGLDADRGQRGDPRSNHVKYPRNMYLARAMSNGCKWYMPEVLAGLPVYAEGELERGAELGGDEAAGDGSEPGWGDVPVAAVHEVEKIIRRARKVGHAGLSDRATAQMTLAGQSEETVRTWIQRAYSELEAFAQGRATPEPEQPPEERTAPADADVVEESPDEPIAADRVAAEEEAQANAGGEREPESEAVVATDELGPLTAAQLDAAIEAADTAAGAALTDREHEEAKAEAARLRELRAGVDSSQQRLDT